ncbi:prophage endopeptidase tail family protein [Staphylococcus arlettae]|uniref:prophage endopeptidase tail family protein n=1 Tax=Staphylococcus arlettae TaxID=29378 RepID=UPI003BA9999E
MKKELIIENKAGNFAEILTDYDLDSFKYEYEINNERSLTFTAYKAKGNEDIFDMLTNENYIIYDGQYFVIKSSTIKYNSQVVTNEIVAKHIFMEFQNHYIDKDVEDEELNTEVTEETTPNYTMQQYIDFAFKNNPLGFTYEIVGDSNNRAPVEELGNKNGVEHIVAGTEYFNYIYFADNKKIYFYQPETFYQRANTPIIYKGNSDELTATVVTTDLKTIGLGYGKKKTKKETKNYSPIKPKDLKYSGSFTKESMWNTTEVGASYSKTFTCKWGNETLTWTRKRGSKGGKVDIYLDGAKLDSFNTYSKTSKTDSLVVAKNLDKGEHTFKAVFRGAQSSVDYKKKAAQMMIGTEKTTILNLTAVLKGSDVYYATTTYKSPNYEAFGHIQAPTIYSDSATTVAQVEEQIKEAMNDEPTVELSTNYLGEADDKRYIIEDDIKENSLVRFIHRPLGFNTELKVVKFTKYHPQAQKPNEVEFSNSKQDIISIQNQINLRIKRANSAIANGNWNVNKNVQQDFYSDVMGSVLTDG